MESESKIKVYMCLYYINASAYMRTEEDLTKDSPPLRSRLQLFDLSIELTFLVILSGFCCCDYKPPDSEMGLLWIVQTF